MWVVYAYKSWESLLKLSEDVFNSAHYPILVEEYI